LAHPDLGARMRVVVVLATVLLLIPSARALSVEAVPQAQYLAYARASADWTWGHWDSLVDAWKKSFDPKNVFGYRPPGGFLEMAVIDAYFNDLQKKRQGQLRQRRTRGDFGKNLSGLS